MTLATGDKARHYLLSLRGWGATWPGRHRLRSVTDVSLRRAVTELSWGARTGHRGATAPPLSPLGLGWSAGIASTTIKRLVVAWNGCNAIDSGQSVGVASDAGAVAMKKLSKQEDQLAEATSTSKVFEFFVFGLVLFVL